MRIFPAKIETAKFISLFNTGDKYAAITMIGSVGSVITSAMKSLDASAKSLDATAKYFGLVGDVLVASAAQDWSPWQGYRFGDKYFGRLGI